MLLGAPRLKIMMHERSSCPGLTAPAAWAAISLRQREPDRPQRADLQEVAAGHAVAGGGFAFSGEGEHTASPDPIFRNGRKALRWAAPAARTGIWSWQAGARSTLGAGSIQPHGGASVFGGRSLRVETSPLQDNPATTPVASEFVGTVVRFLVTASAPLASPRFRFGKCPRLHRPHRPRRPWASCTARPTPRAGHPSPPGAPGRGWPKAG